MSIQAEKLLGIVEDMGLDVETMAAYHKVSIGSRAVYIAKTKKVSRVDLSGFEIKHPAVHVISDEEARDLKLGRVRAQLDFSKDDDRVLEAFRSSLEMMKHLAQGDELPTEIIPQVRERVTARRKGPRRVAPTPPPAKRGPGRPRRTESYQRS